MATSQKRTYTTKKVLSGVRSEFRGWKDWDEEDTLIFKFVGTSKNKLSPTKNNYLVEVLDWVSIADRAEGKRLKPGTRLTLNSAGQFDKGMEQVSEGAIVQVVYKGCHEMEGGKFAGGNAHTMEVSEVEEDTGEETEEEEEEDDEEYDDEDEEDL